MAEEKVERDLKLKRKGKFSKKNAANIKKRKKFNDMKSHEKKFGAKKVDRRMKSLFQKRAREYNSDEEEDDEDNTQKLEEPIGTEFDDQKLEGPVGTEFDDTEGQGEEENVVDEKKDSDEEDEEGAIQPGIMRFSEGCKAFRLAFKKITKRSPTDDDVLGPVLSAHKKLVVAKLAEEEEERKVKGEGKKEKHLVQEKGHAKPANYLDSHEKFLIGVATKGVVKLFNAVNKAQNAQKGLNPSRSKDAKAIRNRRKEAFFSELGKKSSKPGETSGKVGSSTNTGKGDGPSWAPLRENYMLTNPKSKDWDKKPVEADEDDFGGRTLSDTDTSSDDE